LRDKISEDKRLVISAAGQVQKAVDYILGIKQKSYNEEEQKAAKKTKVTEKAL